MQRYTITFVSDTGGGRPSVVVPFQPSALVTSFKDEITKRAIRQNLPIAAETHDLNLRLQSQTGPALDPEDVLSDVVSGSETIFAVFSKHMAEGAASIALPSDTSANASADTSADMVEATGATLIEGDAIKIRVITPATSKQVQNSLKTFDISVHATIKQLHERVSHHLGLPSEPEKHADVNECNCAFARKLSDHHSSTTATFAIHHKSVVDSLQLALQPTAHEIRHALDVQIGMQDDTHKKVHCFGGEQDSAGRYINLPVVAICSRNRHVPASARHAEPLDESDQTWSHVLDLHTSEMPIHTAAMSKKISESGLLDLCIEQVLDIYAVRRSTTPVSHSVCSGKNGVFRDRAYWQPPVKQSLRGTAMFLASLRVTASLLQDQVEDPAAQDAFLHIFDLMCAFPPALRTLHLLIQGKTPSPMECAALSHVYFHVLETFMPEDLIGNTKQRLFESSRLLFGFLFEKSRSIKLHESQLVDSQKWPYLSALEITEARDSVTNEPVAEPVQTEIGVVERAYYQAFSAAGALSLNTMQLPLTDNNVSNAMMRSTLR